MKRRGAIVAIFLFLCGLGWASVATAVPLIVLDQETNTLYEIDTENLGNPREIGVIARGTDLVDLVHFSRDLLMTFDRDANEMIAVRRLTGAVESAVPLDRDIVEQPRGFKGTLDGVFPGVFEPFSGESIPAPEIRSIDPGTGATVSVGFVIGASTIEAMASGPDARWYAVGALGQADFDPPYPPSTTLFELYVGFGIAQPVVVGEMPVDDIDTLTYAPDGFLYGADTVTGESADLYQIDPRTAAVVNLGDTGVNSVSGIVPADAGMVTGMVALSGGATGSGDDIGREWRNIYEGNRVRCEDGSSGRLMFDVNVGTSKNAGGDLVALPDLTADGVTELALLAVNLETGVPEAFVVDGNSGSTLTTFGYVANYSPIELLSIPAAGGSGPGLGVLGTRPNGRVLLMVKNLTDGSVISSVSFSKAFRPFGATVLADMDESGAEEVAVLGVNDDGRPRVQIRDSVTGVQHNAIFFNRNYSPADFIGLPDVFPDGSPEVAMLGISSIDGSVRVLIKEATTGQRVANYRYCAECVSIALVHVPDAGTSGAFGVLERTPDGINRVQMRDALTGLKLPMVPFDRRIYPREVVVLSDTNASGADEIAVLGEGAYNAHNLEIRDSETGTLVARDIGP